MIYHWVCENMVEISMIEEELVAAKCRWWTIVPCPVYEGKHQISIQFVFLYQCSHQIIKGEAKDEAT